MIGIRVNNEFLKLSTEQSITWIRQSGLFDEDGFVRSDYTIPFTVPDDRDGYNARLLQHRPVADLTTNPGDTERAATELPVEIFQGDALISTGTIVTTYKGGSFSCTIFRGMRELGPKFKSTKISELAWSSTGIGAPFVQDASPTLLRQGNATGLAALPTLLAADDIYFPAIFNREFSDDDAFQELNLINLFDGSEASETFLANGIRVLEDYRFNRAVTRDGQGFEIYNGAIEITIDAVVYSSTGGSGRVLDKLRELVADVEAQVDLAVSGMSVRTIQDGAEINTVTTFYHTLEYKDNAADYNTSGSVIAPDLVADFTEYPDEESFRKVELWNRYHYSPAVRMKAVLDQIETDFGIVFQGDLIDEALLGKVYMWTNTSIMQEMNLDQSPVVSGSVTTFQQDFTIGQLLPSWTVATFLKEVARLYGCRIEYIGRAGVIRLDYKKNIIQAAGFRKLSRRHTITDLDRNDGSGFVFRYKEDAAAYGFGDADPDQEVTVGSGEDPVTSRFGFSSNGSATVVWPWFYHRSAGTIDPKLMFENTGLLEIFGFKVNIPLLTTSPQRSVLLSGPFNIWDTFLKDWFEFLNRSDRMTFSIALTYSDLRALEEDQIIVIDRVKYLVRRARVKISSSGSLDADLDVQRLF
jgi:hypothetical protein